MQLCGQEVVFGLPKLGARVSEGACLEQLLPAFRSLAGDRVWLVRGSAAASLPAMAALLPPGMRLRRPFTLIKPPPACGMHFPCRCTSAGRSSELDGLCCDACIYELQCQHAGCSICKLSSGRRSGEN
jgi:hypothetical protein